MGRLVSVVVVTWNSAPFLPRCLAGITGQTHKETELIVVDNASADDSVALVAGAATVIRNETNAGFARAVNQGIAAAHGELVLLVNPDAFLLPEYIERLVAGLDRAGETFGAATGKLLQARGSAIEPAEGIDSQGIRMTRAGRHFDIRDPRLGEGEVFGVSGAAAMYRMSFVRDVSVFGEFLDEDFFAYREDADVAWRGQIMGWHALYVPDAVAYHVRTVTPERRRELSAATNMHGVKNRFLLRMKNESLWLALRNAPFELARDVVTIGAVLTIERTSLPALGWLWRNRKRVWAKRREIQRRRRVSDRALARWFH
jgi:GT2 family glycosyltransferase